MEHLKSEDSPQKPGEDDSLDPKKRGLGRGLSALFDDEEEDIYSGADSETEKSSASRAPQNVPIEMVAPDPNQPRRYFDEEALEELAQSISVHGLLQPILVRKDATREGAYQIVAGERRWRASQKARLHEVPVIIRDMDDVQALEIGLIENLQREDLNPLEEATGYRRLMDEFGHTQEKLAEALGKSRSHVANMVRLLGLPETVKAFVRDGQLSTGHARALITAHDPVQLAEKIVAQGLNVRQTEKLVSGSDGGKANKAQKPLKDVDTLALEREISLLLGMRVNIDVKKGGKGVLKIDFNSLDQLDEVLHRISHTQQGI